MHQREYTVVVRPHSHGLTLHTMFYPEEVREIPEYGKDTNVQIRPQEVDLAEKLVEGLAADFDPSKYHDEYQTQLGKLIEAKKEGLEVKGTAPKKLAPVIDLMQALQQSLGQMPQRKPAAKVTSIETEAPKEAPKKPRARAAR
jgi:DNA end-binding protein Ku